MTTIEWTTKWGRHEVTGHQVWWLDPDCVVRACFRRWDNIPSRLAAARNQFVKHLRQGRAPALEALAVMREHRLDEYIYFRGEMGR